MDTTEIIADGTWKDLSFDYPAEQSGWVAMRIFPSVHTNPVFVLVDNKPIHVAKSAEWCREALDQCWKMKLPGIREEERTAAKTAYDKARTYYQAIIDEANKK